MLIEELIKIESDGISEDSLVEINLKDIKVIDYQIEMINQNTNSSIIALSKKVDKEEEKLTYNCKGLTSLKDYLTVNKINKVDLLNILEGICKVLIKSKDYYLNINNFILLDKIIFLDIANKEIKLMYLPMENEYCESINESFKVLVKKVIVNSVIIEEDIADNYIQTILNEINNPELTVFNFSNTILELRRKTSNNISNLQNNDKITNINNNNSYINKAVKNESNTYINNENESEVEEKKYVYSNIRKIIFALVQVIFVPAAIFVFFEVYKYDIMKKSILVGLIVALDLLITVLIFDSSKKKEIIVKKNNNDSKLSNNTQLNNMDYIKDEGKATFNEHKEIEKSRNETLEKDLSNNEGYETVLLNLSVPYLLFSNYGVLERINITKDTFILGRLSTVVDYVIENSAVGKKHAEIIKKDGEYYLKDLNSKNGTFINGNRLTPNQECLLKENDEVTLANMTMSFKI